jgi:hypothetical protein
VAGHGARLRAVRTGALALRERLAAGRAAVSVRTFPLATVPYPARYAFWAAALSPAPYVTLVHRCLLVQFRQDGALKTLLFNPSDVERARRTPFFARMLERYGEWSAKFLSKTFDPLEKQLAALGLAPDDIDYVAFDHFHTQDLRRLLGTTDGEHAPRFPRAQLLASRNEWAEWDDLHPMQRAWFVADGRKGVREDRVVFLDDDVQLGEGVALVRTPGHTTGNRTLFIKTDRGIWGCSENGTAADSWSPLASRIAGVASTAKQQDLEVLLNGNTVEGGADQYTSLVLEKTVVDRVPYNSDFCQMFPSSEVTPTLTAPGLSPSYQHNQVVHGEVVDSAGTRAAQAAPAPSGGGSGFGAIGA